MNKVRLGIIGLGNMGSHHARTVLDKKIDRCELTAVCDHDEQKLKNYNTIKTFTKSQDLIRSGAIDAVLIATPHYDHTLIGIDALEQGLHVLVEKPISVHKADCERLIAAYKNKDKVFGAMFNQRTDPHYTRVKKLIADGDLGKIRRVNWIITDWFRTEAYYASGGWRATWRGEGGGVLLNQCPHNLDLFQWLVGMPSKVRAFCNIGKYHNIEVEDEVTAYMEFANGASAVFITSTGEAPGTNRLEITSDRGKVVIEKGKVMFTRTEVPVSEFCKTNPGKFSRPDLWEIDIPVSGHGGQHTEITQNFVDAIVDRKPLIAPAVEGIHSVELANAMLYSSFTGRSVELPLDAKTYEEHLKKLISESKFEKKTVKQADEDMGKSFGKA